ncbi:hypothetical protein [Nocardiopsis sp. Huas11]|nr:hypothetical protein [Nocardiopsis sp. Huas11]
MVQSTISSARSPLVWTCRGHLVDYHRTIPEPLRGLARRMQIR